MPNPYLVACLARLRDQFNHEFPARAKGSDGWIGDAFHDSTSDHAPDRLGRVRALDITTELNRPGVTLWAVCEDLRLRHQLGLDNRLEYIIHDGKIAGTWNGWVWETYTGTSDPHTNHAHFSARADGTGYTDTRPWGLEDIVTRDELRTVIREELNVVFAVSKQADGSDTSLIGRRALGQGIPNPFKNGKRTPAYVLLGDVAARVKALEPKDPITGSKL